MRPLQPAWLLQSSLLLITFFNIVNAKQPKHKRLKTLSPAQMLKEYTPAINTTYAELESSIVSWTGAQIDSKKSERLEHSAVKKAPKKSTKRRKTKGGLLIESNVDDIGEDINSKGQLNSKRNKQDKQRKRKSKFQRNALRLLNSQSEMPNTAAVGTGGLFPPLFNVATRATITVNATCGQYGAEEYCKLVDAYPHRNWAKQCGTCNAHSSDVAKQRPIESIISNSNFDESWWQSPTLQGGRQFEYVTITLDLKQIYQIFFVMLKSANSPRPASWILEKSLDGLSYEPWQYFGLSDADCRHRYNLPAQTGKYIFQNDTEIICTTQFSKPLPLENGELHISLLKNRPGAIEQTAELLNFITARYIRIRLQGMHSTANLDNSVDWLLDAQSLEKRSFYSLKQIRVSGRLDCHGHAERTVELATKNISQHMAAASSDTILHCLCQHNTCGIDCASCCPLFQDKPFRNGTASDAHECEICQCNGHAENCVYDNYLERGICLDCGNHTAGNECEFCSNGYYRKLGATPSEPCLHCECNEKSSRPGCQPEGGACYCKEGFQGHKCDECASGYYGEGCQRCKCDTRGTISDSECAGDCICKPNVGGDTCSVCLHGYYNLDANNAEGCTACWCSGVTEACQSAHLQTLAFETLNDWKITDMTCTQTVAAKLDTESNKLIYGMLDFEHVEAIYWLAPQGYLGNRLSSYGARLSMQVSWVTIRGDTSGKPTAMPHVILFGANGMKIAYGDEIFDHVSSALINVTLNEQGWYHVPLTVQDIKTRLRRTEHQGLPVTRAQMLSVLVSIEALLIRATYHTDQVETSLEHAIIYTGGTELGGLVSRQVEQCICPLGYTGLSCENCAFGYKRIYENSTQHQLVAKCIPCPCNGHSNSCDLQSGNCGDCMHNTYGERCERCQIGYYGNPLLGTSNDCKRCACPLLVESNNFSPSCQLKTYSILDMNPQLGLVENAEYICTQCPIGYIGDHCQICDDGFWGNPTIVGSQCLPCACKGGPCQVETGACIICEGNTEGWHCERCKLGYWGDPAVGCLPCDCYEDGAESTLCDSVDGQCLCRPRYAGQKCNECAMGYANIDLKCLPCNCDELGALVTNACDPNSGQCTCKEGVVGLKCNQCADGYYGMHAMIELQAAAPTITTTTTTTTGTKGTATATMLKDEHIFVQPPDEMPLDYADDIDDDENEWELAPVACVDCQCNTKGALSSICDKRTGKCVCHANVAGRRCDKCTPGHWNLTEGVGCHDCRCDPAGSRSHECNPWTGQCDCKIGVGGQHCNECTEGFFGFSADGCQRCAACTAEGQICDTINGRCICPKNTRGLACAQCIPGTWGWQARLGCQLCNCDYVGSIGQRCDASKGQCQCREGYSGRQCNSCAIGYFGYPECRRCNCNPDGSLMTTNGLIACDANGQCPCKSLVVGLKCDTCMQSTFGLSALNPEGCTSCFCFGRSTECEQSAWSWGHIRMTEARNLSVQYVRPQHVPNGEYEYIAVIQMTNMLSTSLDKISYHAVDAEISRMNDLTLIPHSGGNVSIGAYGNFYQPLYFQLPPQFHGDRTSSYGGYLYFTITIEGSRTPLERKVLAQYPLVQLHSHTRLVLDFYEYNEFEYALNITYKVPLHESYWKYHHNSQAVDRATVMAALQNVKHIFLRAFTFADFEQVILQNVHMDSALYVYGATNMIAKSVEHCKCPKQYDGLSCQDPGHGFYRWRNVTEIETIFIEDIIGRAAPCQCNERSNKCDRETGICFNCRENTGGAHCEQCAEGYYGDPNSVQGCQSCPCPETSRNFARECNVYDGEVSCICKPGYTGRLCDRCRTGYFGDPLAFPNSTCQPCNCNLNGINADGCDPVTGQCYCRKGVTALKCDVCLAERHHLIDSGCKLCDNCTLLLLDYSELIGHKLRRGVHNIDLTGIPAPYLKVEKYEQWYSTLNLDYQDFNNARQLVINYDVAGLLKMDSQAENNKFQFRKALATTTKWQHVINVLNSDAEALYTKVNAISTDISQTLYYLNNYGKGAQHLSLPTALKQARFYLDAIQQHHQSVDEIRSTTDCAWLHYYYFGNTSAMLYDQQSRVEMLWRDLNQTNFRLSDLRLQTDRTLDMQGEIDDILEHVKNLKVYVVEDYGKITEFRDFITDKLNNDLMIKTNTTLELNLNKQNELGDKIEAIIELAALLNATLLEKELVQREVRKHWLPKSQRHAEHLTERSNEYARQFQSTRNGAKIAMLASSAHKNISDAIDAARKASFEAKERVYMAQSTLYPPDGGSMIEKAKHSLNKSKSLQSQALQEMHLSNVLKEQLKHHEDRVERIKSSILDSEIRTNNISSQLHNLLNTSVENNALESLEIAKQTSDEMRSELKKAYEMHKSIQKLREKFSILEPDWKIKLGLAEENISLTRTNLRLANISLTYIEEQAKKEQETFNTWNNTMSKQLQELKNKIAKARHAADSIKVSMESLGPKCARSYLPTSFGLTTSNSIKLSFTLSNHMGNSPLLYVQGTEGRFIALELYKRHVRLIWQLGGNTATITHPLEIQTRDPKYDDAWYHVEANRTLNIGSLLVRRMNNYGALMPGNTITGNTEMEHTRFFQTRYERIYLGGYPAAVHVKELQMNPGLNVVVHKLEVDNKPIGIWNFIETEGRCGGAMIGAQESSVSTSARHFNGLGYAEVKKLRPRPYRKHLFALQMTFRTLDENALLFLAVDDKNNRSISVTLSRGRIMFRIDYGDESKLEINTTNKYNTGEWIKIEAAREFSPKRGTENGRLKVNNERAISGSPTVPIKSHMLPDLSKTIYYLGGVPPGFTSGTTKAPGADNPFLGCMMDVQVNGETYDPLESSTYFGVEPSCKDMTTKAGFTGDGYLELPSQSLRKRANMGLVFRTLQPDCLLLLAAYPPEIAADYDAKDIRGNYSVSLISGHLQAWLNSGRSFIKLSSNATLNDGEFHVIHLLKNGRKFELMIDDVVHDVRSFSSSPTLLSMPRESGGLYIGGAPSYEEYTPLAPTFIKLEGSVRDVVFNNRTINFNEALTFVNTQIGRNGPAMGRFNGIYDVFLKTEPMIGKSFTASPEGCKRIGSYSYEPNAYKFGDEPYSYAQLKLPERNFWQRNFHLTFDFRSFYPNGMIYLSPGTKEKQKHYVALLLKDGQLLLIVRGRRREELQLTAKLNDGEWHHVTISCHERKVTMSVEIGRTDQKTSAQMKVPKKIATSQQLIMGGLLETPIKLPTELYTRLESFKGCLRLVRINNSTQDLARPGKHMNVGQCFPKVERGSYFPGDAYAIYKKNFHVGKYLELEMEFRTWELSGVLLSISEPTGFPALSLELNNGNIVFSCDLGDGVPFRVQSLLPNKYALCDNKWHNISALYDYEQIALRIDQLPATISVAPQISMGKVQTKSPLYIGGIPEIAPSGALLSRENFKGCIRNVSIRNERRDWIDMDDLHNVLLSECLISSDENL